MYIKGVMRSRGKPKSYQSAKQLADKVQAYFASISQTARLMDDDGDDNRTDNGELYKYTRWLAPPSQQALAVYLGIDRKTWERYSKDAETYGELTQVAQLANLVIESYYAEEIATRDRPQGAQFVLSCNYGWTDARKVEIKADVSADVNVANMSLADKLAMIRSASDSVTAVCDDGNDT